MHADAEQAVKALQRAGIDMHTMSIIGKDSHTDEQAAGYYNNGDRMKYWGKAGAFWGDIWGLLFGSAFFVIPGIGAMEGAVISGGLTAIGAGLYGMGIPKGRVIEYETALKTDQFLLIVHDTAQEVERARSVIEGTRPITMTLQEGKRIAASVI